VVRTIPAGTVEVATECHGGSGTMTTKIGSLATYTARCTVESSGTYNEIAWGSATKNAVLAVRVPSGVRWGLSVGWRPGHGSQR
jgi:hypothetical protein